MISGTKKSLNYRIAAGIVIVPDAFNADASLAGIEFLKSAFLLARTNAGYLMEAAKEKGAFLTVVSFLGGGFGFPKIFSTDPVYGGLAGLAKTAGLEWKNVFAGPWTCRIQGKKPLNTPRPQYIS